MQMLTYRRLYLLVMLIACCNHATASTVPNVQPEALTRIYYQAFNDRNLVRIDELLAEEFEWAAIANGERKVEVRGKQALLAWLTNYFEACPSCRSEILSLETTGMSARIHERMHWQNNRGEWQQAEAKAVYQYAETGLLEAVTYQE